ncbi:DegT/DnrJ/EryC1/StrS family aminotransferase [Syntrophothermus sp.]|uniref:DegT/DnrJ/EryC1/StrS family aminotransferase n=1 Tax=Syntrophothermus sp. TaxID=2736299 RepID=UPI00257D9FE5|nr:DegT/DnrJ/EryC1/StrS family aminotransferase [Syntrophothermus sp.]
MGEEEKMRVLEVLDSGELAPGDWTRQFEDSFAEYLGMKHAVATSSGTAALQAAVESVGLVRGDKVFTTPFTFISTVSVLVACGLVPVFVDIDGETYNLDPEKLAEAMEEHPEAKGVMVVHLYGLPADVNTIAELAEKRGMLVIEDCAQAHGARVKDRHVGTFGKAGAFSFYGSKNITTGEGGMVVTDDDLLAEKVRMFINHGQRERYHYEVLGYNFRMSNVNAAIGLEQVKKLDFINRKRRENAAYFNRHIDNPLVLLPKEPEGYYHVYHQYTVRVMGDRNRFVQHLVNNGIGCGIYYPSCLTEQPIFQRTGYIDTGTDIAREAARQVVSLPVYPGLGLEELERIVLAVNSYRE